MVEGRRYGRRYEVWWKVGGMGIKWNLWYGRR